FAEIEKTGAIDPVKLAFLKEMHQATQGVQKDKDKMMAFMMNVAMKSREQNIRFSKEEMDIIIKLLKQNATPSENAVMDTIIKKGLNN
ncbi:MAG: hypothetical protein IJD31_05250, partial [Lachnospiraceae bacterium]|nr:hypothetical protein [Lachnospiraceae bacterium]